MPFSERDTRGNAAKSQVVKALPRTTSLSDPSTPQNPNQTAARRSVQSSSCRGLGVVCGVHASCCNILDPVSATREGRLSAWPTVRPLHMPLRFLWTAGGDSCLLPMLSFAQVISPRPLVQAHFKSQNHEPCPTDQPDNYTSNVCRYMKAQNSERPETSVAGDGRPWSPRQSPSTLHDRHGEG